MPQAQPKHRLTWCLVKPDIHADDREAIIEPPDTGMLEAYRVPALDAARDALYIKRTSPVAPKWVGYLSDHVVEKLPRVLGASSSAVLLVPAGERLLAVTFGYGHALLREEALVHDFGLKVVLNSVNPAQIKSVDARTYDELTVYTRRGVSHNSPLNAFELDVTRNLLRGITGSSETEELPGQLTGASALSMNTTLQVPQLPALGAALIDTYAARRYRKHFRFIDDMRAERDPATILTLDGLLLDAIKSGELTDMHLAIPEAVDWQEIAGVRFSLKRKHHEPAPDPSISTYLRLRDPHMLTVERLKKDKVEAISALDEDQVKKRWRVYACIVYETPHAGRLYVLSGGDWYRISNRYRTRVQASVGALPELDIGLPHASPAEDERTYNRRAAAHIKALCLDGKLIATGGPDSMEVCDILTRDGTLLHVKKRGRSSTLSHLFAQGVSSAEMLLHDQPFLDATAALVAGLDSRFAAAIPKTLRAREQIKVAFVVLSRSRRTDTPHGLPFFSLVSLQAAARHLQDAGIEVHVQQVKESGTPPGGAARP
jgi:uncharacterized protein (TIGR04141 family)